jgi:hypothetical protein
MKFHTGDAIQAIIAAPANCFVIKQSGTPDTA